MTPEEIKKFECVKRWLDTIYAQGTGSSGTQSLYPSQLCYFLNFARLNPDELIKVAQDHPDRLKDLVNGYTRQRREAPQLFGWSNDSRALRKVVRGRGIGS
jgi:hypothetical protein